MINSFTGNYRFLSNFVDVGVEFDGLTYQSLEHAYQASKTIVPHERAWIWSAQSAAEAKKRGKKVTLRDDWDRIKLINMEYFLRQKFNNIYFRRLLAETGQEELIESNYWHDIFWGKCTCKNKGHNNEGENHLGRLLMKIRQEILDERS